MVADGLYLVVAAVGLDVLVELVLVGGEEDASFVKVVLVVASWDVDLDVVFRLDFWLLSLQLGDGRRRQQNPDRFGQVQTVFEIFKAGKIGRNRGEKEVAKISKKILILKAEARLTKLVKVWAKP